MSPEDLPRQTGFALSLFPLQARLEDFDLSREAMCCTSATPDQHKDSMGKFVEWGRRRAAADHKNAGGHVR